MTDLNKAAEKAVNATSLLGLIEAKNDLEELDLGYNAMTDAVIIGGELNE